MSAAAARPAIVEALVSRAGRHPHAPAVRFEGETVTCAEAVARAFSVGNGLRALGVGQGDRVVLLLPNGLEFLDAYFGLASIGGAAVPVNTAQRGPTLRHVLADSGARVAIVDPSLVGAVAEAWPEHPLELVVVGEASWDALRAAPRTEPGVDTGGRQPIGILYTSGTTGPPKGVVADGYDLRPASILLATLDATPGETIFTCLPLFHGNALMLSAMGSVTNDWVLALGRRFSARRFWDEVRASGAVSFTALGAMIPILLKAPPDRRDRDHGVRTVISAACPAWAWEAFEERFGVRLVEFYGMVDSPGLLVNAEGRVGAMGRAVTGVDFRVVDGADAELADGEVGELVFRHPAGRLTHYHGLPEATEDAYRGGWFHSGDLARRDAGGWFTYCGRTKESMRRRGENISAWEVENVVDQLDGVLESAAHAVPSELGEDEVKVVVVAEPGASLAPPEIVAWCEGRMAAYAVPRYVELRDELPKTGTHRTQYAQLKAEGITPTTWDRANQTEKSHA